MPTANVPLFLDQYTDSTIVYTWSVGPVGGPFLPVDLSGCGARAKIRTTPSSGSALVAISTTPSAQGSIVLGGVAGTIAGVSTCPANPPHRGTGYGGKKDRRTR